MSKSWMFFLWCSFCFLLACQKEENVLPQGDWLTSTAPIPELMMAEPQQLGISPDQLAGIVDELESLGYVNSFLMSVHDTLINETYFNGADQSSSFNIKSVSKCLISTLAGIALNEQKLDSLTAPVISFFPDFDMLNPDTLMDDLHLDHLLKMSSGLDYLENETEGVLFSEHWVRNILSLPFAFQPGTNFRYGTINSHLVSAALAEATQMSTRAYAESRLFEPLGISVDHWVTDPQGYHMGGSDVYMTARSLMKFGNLVLRNGQYEGQSLISSDWVRAMLTSKYANFQGGIGGFGLNGYGYYWYLSDDGRYDTVFGWGFGGQILMLIPEVEAVVVVNMPIEVTSEQTFERSGTVLGILRDQLFELF